MKLESIISSFAQKHSTYTLPDELANIQATGEENQEAIDWFNDFDANIPGGVGLVTNYDNAYYSDRNYDLSQVYYYKSNKYAIYSYNNNAYGCCDVFPIADDPGSIEDWLRLWDIEALPERWLANLIDKEDDYDDLDS